MSKTAKVFLLLGGIFLALAIVAVVAIVFAVGSVGGPSVANNSVLVLNISGELPDYVAEEPLAKAFGVAQPQSFTSLLTQLRKAKVMRPVSQKRRDRCGCSDNCKQAGNLARIGIGRSRDDISRHQ